MHRIGSQIGRGQQAAVALLIGHNPPGQIAAVEEVRTFLAQPAQAARQLREAHGLAHLVAAAVGEVDRGQRGRVTEDGFQDLVRVGLPRRQDGARFCQGHRRFEQRG